jgi:FixJ family two-component response regulator
MRTVHAKDYVSLYVVDADASVRDALCRLATSAGLQARSFASVEQFVTQSSADWGGCVLLDSSLLGEAARVNAERCGRGLDRPVIMMCASDSAAGGA